MLALHARDPKEIHVDLKVPTDYMDEWWHSVHCEITNDYNQYTDTFTVTILN